MLLSSLRGLLVGLALLLATSPALAQGKKHAVLVGVTEYDHRNLTSLKYTGNDVEELAKALQGFDSLRVLNTARGKAKKEDAPTAVNVSKALEGLLAKRNKNDLILVAFAGHGVTIEVKDPDGKGDPRTYSYFCLRDADLLDVRYRDGFSKTMVNLDDLFLHLGRSGAGTKLMLIDACRNELKIQAGRRSLDARSVTIPDGVAALYSCGRGQFAFETSKLGKGHGVFFHYVLQGLKGKAKNNTGEITWESLGAYVRKRVTREVPELIGGGARQEPHAMGSLGGQPAVLALTEAEREFREGSRYFHGDGRTLNYPSAAKHFQKAAGMGHLIAKGYLAWAHSGGYGVAKDLERTERLVKETLPGLQEADEHDNLQATNLLGCLYWFGAGVPRDEKKSVAYWRKSATSGLALSQHGLAMAYAEGRGVAKDQKEALVWIRKAAEAGLTESQNWMGLWADGGVAMPRSDAEALRWYLAAAEGGHGWGAHNAGIFLEYGRGTKRDVKEAAKWYQKGGERGALSAYFRLADMHAKGALGPKNEREALSLYRKDEKEAVAWLTSAHTTSGCPERYLGELLSGGAHKDEKAAFGWYVKAEAKAACKECSAVVALALARMHEHGRGTPKKEKEAFAWYVKAAERKQAEAMYRLGLIHADALLGVKKDDKVAVDWYRKAADLGNRDGHFALAIHYRDGRGVKSDAKESMKWWLAAAERGHAHAANDVGLNYERGYGVDKPDQAKAAHWYRKAGELGAAWGSRNLALCYLQGRGVPRDYKEAAKWSIKAGEQGLSEPWVWLGDLHANGSLGAKNDKEAVVWYRKAADKGDAYGQFRLAEMYRDGRAVPKDEKQARQWFEKAVAQKHAPAIEALKKLGK